MEEFLQGKQSCCWNVTAVSLDRQDETANVLQTAACRTPNQVSATLQTGCTSEKTYSTQILNKSKFFQL